MSTNFETTNDGKAQFTKSPDEIERDIDATRAELNRILEALENKMSVRRRVDGMVSSARANAWTAAGMAVNAFNQYRTPIVAAGAAAVGLLLLRGISRRRSF